MKTPKIGDIVKVSGYTNKGIEYVITGVFNKNCVDEDNIPYYMIGESKVYRDSIRELKIVK